MTTQEKNQFLRKFPQAVCVSYDSSIDMYVAKDANGHTMFSKKTESPLPSGMSFYITSETFISKPFNIYTYENHEDSNTIIVKYTDLSYGLIAKKFSGSQSGGQVTSKLLQTQEPFTSFEYDNKLGLMVGHIQKNHHVDKKLINISSFDTSPELMSYKYYPSIKMIACVVGVEQKMLISKNLRTRSPKVKDFKINPRRNITLYSHEGTVAILIRNVFKGSVLGVSISHWEYPEESK